MANKTYSKKNQDKLKVFLEKQTNNGSKDVKKITVKDAEKKRGI